MRARPPACARQGLPASLRFGLLGGYDGASAWTLTHGGTGNRDEQFVVELHEYLHHELQTSSGWGLVLSMALLLARDGTRRYALEEVFQIMVDASRETHEIFATVLSATTDGVEHARELLADNPRYLGYLDRGLALVDDGDARIWQLHHAAVAAVLRVCMRPTSVLDLIDRGFGRLRRSDLDIDRDGPDRRLAGGPSSWGPVFAQLVAEYPDRGGDSTDGLLRGRSIDSAEFDRLRRFEEEVLNPRCHAHVCAVLDAAGLPSVSSRQQSRMAEALRSAVAAVAPAIAQQLQLVTERRQIWQEAPEYARQRIRLRDPLRVEVHGPEQTLRHVDTFRTVEADGHQHVCAVWMDREVAVKQFAFDDPAGLPELVTALIATAGEASARRRVRLGILPAQTTPQELQHLLGDTPLLVLTTHLTLARHGTALQVLQRCAPVFVLMDLPVLRHVGHWIGQGATVRVAQSTHDGGLPADVAYAALAINRDHPFVFVCIGGEVGVHVMVDQLRREHDRGVQVDPTVLADHRAGLTLIVRHVMQAWHVLDQTGAR